MRKNGQRRAGNGAIDWDLVKSRLAHRDLGTYTDEDLDRIFRQRAQTLAQAGQQHERSAVATHLECKLGGITLLVPLSYVLRILRPGWLARVPGAPSVLDRIMHVDGKIVAVVEVGRLFGVEREADPSEPLVVLLGDGSERLGLAVDSVKDLVGVDQGALSPVTAHASPGAEFVHGLGPELELVLDAEQLIHGLMAQDGSSHSQGATG